MLMENDPPVSEQWWHGEYCYYERLADPWGTVTLARWGEESYQNNKTL